MADKRKLQAEIDRCIKKVLEGVELFDGIWSKVQEAASTNQKEKFEADLKKEIKKLQRLRDQIKGWQNSNEVKDKTQLCEHRKLIEQKMEQFKIVERETKTKAYSKVGLGSEQKVDPKEKEKEETICWLQEMIDRLGQKIDLFEGEQEQIGATISRKKKPEKDKQERLDLLKKLLERHQYHVQKLELILRLLNNSCIEASDLKSIREDVNYFIDNCEDPTYGENEYMYDDLDLPAAEQLAQQLGNFLPSHPVEASEDNSGSDESSKPSSRPSSRQSSIISKDSSKDVKERKTRYTSESGEVTKLLMGKLQAFSKSAPSTPVKMIGNDNYEPKMRPQPNAAPVRVLPVPYSVAASAERRIETPLSFAEVTLRKTDETTEPVCPSSFVEVHATPTNATASDSPPLLLNLASPRPDVQFTSSSVTLEANQRNSFADFVLNGPISDSAQITSTILSSVQQRSLDETTSRRSYGDATPRCVSSDAGSYCMTDGDAAAAAVVVDDQSPTANDIDHCSASPMECLYDYPPMLSVTEPLKLDPTLGCSPFGTMPMTTDMLFNLTVLEAQVEHLPKAFVTALPRRRLPRMPCKTPAYYPKVTPDFLDNVECFMRFSPEVLFFVFYHFRETKAQYFAAKALKRQSWRYHTKCGMWFQRHEEPQVITDEYEKGTYVYFDYVNWQQRKKENFTFEYRYLEDRDLG